MDHIIIIPSLNPDTKLITLVDELTGGGADKIIIVNDGSDADHTPIFELLKGRGNVIVLEHAVNLGKGAALKTAFSYCAEHFRCGKGVITADCDGQHTAKDIFRIAEAMTQTPGRLIMGVRPFSKSSTPWRSYFGNTATNRFYNFIYHINLSDTQTGLRGIPLTELEWMAKIRGQRYDYELNILIQSRRRGLKIEQIPIEIVYFDNNQGSHFRTVSDSLLIIKMLVSNLIRKTGKGAPYYGKLFYFCRWLLRIVNKKYTIIGEPPSKPVILVGHHQNLKGALRILIWLNIDVRMWMLWVFCNKKDCFDQYYGYTFTLRYGWNKIFAAAAAYAASRCIPKLAAAARVIPVYRKSIKNLNKTINESVGALHKNENLLLFPDVDYTSDSDSMGEMYMGFIALDKYYHISTGTHIDFVPVKVNTAERQISFGKPSRVKDDEKYSEAKVRIGRELRSELN